MNYRPKKAELDQALREYLKTMPGHYLLGVAGVAEILREAFKPALLDYIKDRRREAGIYED